MNSKELLNVEKCVTRQNLQLAADICLVAGLISIIGSIVTWFAQSKSKSTDPAHAERFGIFVGLWVPSFLILANLLSRKADQLER